MIYNPFYVKDENIALSVAIQLLKRLDSSGELSYETTEEVTAGKLEVADIVEKLTGLLEQRVEMDNEDALDILEDMLEYMMCEGSVTGGHPERLEEVMALRIACKNLEHVVNREKNPGKQTLSNGLTREFVCDFLIGLMTEYAKHRSLGGYVPGQILMQMGFPEDKDILEKILTALREMGNDET